MTAAHHAGGLALAGALALWGTGGVVAARVIASDPELQAASQVSVAARLFGNATRALGEFSYYRLADQAYHGGTEHFDETAFTDLFGIYREEIAPSKIRHMQGNEVKDVLAWIRIAMSLDPGNAEYAVVASYWLEREMNRPDLALAVLDEAALNNPGSYLPHIGRGQIYSRLDQREKAQKAFERALILWPSDDDPTANNVLSYKREALDYLATLAEVNKDPDRALFYLRRILQDYPSKPGGATRRIAAIMQGTATHEAAIRTWDVIRQQARYQDKHDLEAQAEPEVGSDDHHDHDHHDHGADAHH